MESGDTIGFCVLGVVMLLAAFAGALIPDLREQPGTPLDDADNAELGLVPAAGNR